MKKAIVAHTGSRDHYQLSLALQEKGLLERLVTDFYGNQFLNRLHPTFNKRYCNGLPSYKVKKSHRVIGLRLLQLFRKEHKELAYRKQDDALSQATLDLANMQKTNLFLYSYYAYDAFKNYSGGQKFLFQVHPHPITAKRILTEELERIPLAEESLKGEAEMALPEVLLDKLSQEALMADGIVVASSFTKRSLIENGVAASLIKIIPYGVDLEIFNMKNKRKNKGLFRIIFVGNIIQRKGIHDLLKAVELLNSQNIHLTLCGRIVDEGLLKEFSHLSNLTLKFNIPRSELISELNKSDVFLFPSLLEGFGLAVLEAMACGLPVIATRNTCAFDIIDDGKDGYLVGIRSPYQIAEKIEQMIQDRNSFDMGMAARAKASKYTWQRFRNEISEHYVEMATKS